jgi:hypothetical protein
MKIRQEISLYLTLAKTNVVNPNFFLSIPYLTLCKAKCYMENNWVWLESDKWCLFPPLPIGRDVTAYPNLKIWSDFSDMQPNYNKSEFLDYEYIFSSIEFNNLSGGKWEVFRKNIRKWPKAHPNWVYNEETDEGQTELLLAEWFEFKKEDVLDPELVIKFALSEKMSGIHRKYLYDEEGALVAINIWDDNWKYINFRYCIINKEQPYLDEFARYCFYTDPDIQKFGKLINDGGCLGNAGLERFKDKLHPVRKREVHSWFI